MCDAFMSVRHSLFKTCIAIILGAMLFPISAFTQADLPESFKFEISCFAPVDLGQTATATVSKTAGSLELLGFTCLISYNENILTFLSAEPGELLADGKFDQFAYYLADSGHISTEEQTGLIRITGFREIYPGSNTNPPVTGIGEFIKLNFAVMDYPEFQCTIQPLRFIWFDCGDNSLVVKAENPVTTLISDQVIDWNSSIDISDPLAEVPTIYGAPDGCEFLSSPNPWLRMVDFQNGGIPINCLDDIDDRGDVNLNGIAYEVADYVVYVNYFIHGFLAFTINVTAQTAATDINADGIPLTLNDLIYLIRIIEGDVLPYPGAVLRNFDFSGAVALIETDTSVIIRTQFEQPVGGLYLTFYSPSIQTVDDYSIREFLPVEQINFYHYMRDSTLNILIFEGPQTYGEPVTIEIEGDLADIFEIVYTGSKPELIHYEASGYLGELVDFRFTQLPNSPPVFETYPSSMINNAEGTFRYDFNAFDSDNPSDWIRFEVAEGPGIINEITGEYFYANLCDGDDPTVQVRICASDGVNRCSMIDPSKHAIMSIDLANPPPDKGDINFDGSIDLLDIQFMINYLYKGGAEPLLLDAVDTNNDNIINILDIIFIINYKFKDGPPPICD